DRRKWARQAARSILPNATETKIFVTGNARAWRHFLELRGSVHADTEIRLLAVEVCRVLKKESPNIFQDIELIDEPDGMPSVRVTHSKVERSPLDNTVTTRHNSNFYRKLHVCSWMNMRISPSVRWVSGALMAGMVFAIAGHHVLAARHAKTKV